MSEATLSLILNENLLSLITLFQSNNSLCMTASIYVFTSFVSLCDNADSLSFKSSAKFPIIVLAKNSLQESLSDKKCSVTPLAISLAII